jgi:glycosyltransferase involved in cell wall biosynthesis
MLIKKVSIIIPCYNEKKTIARIIEILNNKIKIKKQIILIDDCSTDGTRDLIKSKFLNKFDKVIFHKTNQGKGSCIISAQKYISGDLVIIQDADMEYNPVDLIKIINLFKKKLNIEVVYGSRFLNQFNNVDLSFPKKFRVIANFILTFINNIFNRQNLTDAHTCYKVFSKKNDS